VSTWAQHVSVTLGQRYLTAKIYATVCPSLPYLWHHSWTAL